MDDMHRNVHDLRRDMQDIRESLDESQSLQLLVDEIDAEYFHVCFEISINYFQLNLFYRMTQS